MATLETIPMTHWGQDHSSMLGYIMMRAVDRQNLEGDRIRVNASRHPAVHRRHGHTRWESSYGTRLKGKQHSDHDDYDVILDFEAEGLIEIVHGPETAAFQVVPTLKGEAYICALMVHKMRGGNFSDFDWEGVEWRS